MAGLLIGSVSRAFAPSLFETPAYGELLTWIFIQDPVVVSEPGQRIVDPQLGCSGRPLLGVFVSAVREAATVGWRGR